MKKKKKIPPLPANQEHFSISWNGFVIDYESKEKREREALKILKQGETDWEGKLRACLDWEKRPWNSQNNNCKKKPYLCPSLRLSKQSLNFPVLYKMFNESETNRNEEIIIIIIIIYLFFWKYNNNYNIIIIIVFISTFSYYFILFG